MKTLTKKDAKKVSGGTQSYMLDENGKIVPYDPKKVKVEIVR